MTQYNSLNVKLSNSQLNKLNSVIKKESEVQSWTKGWRQIDKIKQNRFSYEMVYS